MGWPSRVPTPPARTDQPASVSQNIDVTATSSDGSAAADLGWTGVVKDSKRAWLVCIAAFAVQVILVGVLHAFGVFFVALLEEFQCSKAAAAWLPSIAYGVTMSLAPVASLVIRRYGNHVSTLVGTVICSVSLLVSSFATSLQLMYFTFGFIYGLGLTLCYTPTMTIASDYFSAYVTTATGLMVAGSSVGTLTLTPAVQVMTSTLGWRNAMRILSGLVLVGLVCGYTFKPRPGATRPVQNPGEQIKSSLARRMIKDLKLWKNRVYVIWVIAMTSAMFGYYIPYVHLVSYASDVGISPARGSILVTVLGAATATGRVLFGKIVDYGYLHRVQMDQLSLVVTGTAAMLLPLIRSFGGLLAYVICIGLVDGCFVVLLPMLTTTLVGVENKVLAWGYLSGIGSITFTLGPPVAGWLYDMMGSYDVAFHIAGVPIILAAIVLFFIPWAQRTGQRTNIMAAAQSYNVMEEVAVITGNHNVLQEDDRKDWSDFTPTDQSTSSTLAPSSVGSRKDDLSADVDELQFAMLDLDEVRNVEERSKSDCLQANDVMVKLREAENELTEIMHLTPGGYSVFGSGSAISFDVAHTQYGSVSAAQSPGTQEIQAVGEEMLVGGAGAGAGAGAGGQEGESVDLVDILHTDSSTQNISGRPGDGSNTPTQDLLTSFTPTREATSSVHNHQSTSNENPFTSSMAVSPQGLAGALSVSPPGWHASPPPCRNEMTSPFETTVEPRPLSCERYHQSPVLESQYGFRAISVSPHDFSMALNPQVVSGENLYQPVNPHVVSGENLYQPVNPHVVSGENLYQPVNPHVVSGENLYQPVNPHVVSGENLYQPVNPQVVSGENVYQPVNPQVVSGENLYQPVNPQVVSGENLYQPVNPQVVSGENLYQPVNPQVVSGENLYQPVNPQVVSGENLYQPVNPQVVSGENLYQPVSLPPQCGSFPLSVSPPDLSRRGHPQVMSCEDHGQAASFGTQPGSRPMSFSPSDWAGMSSGVGSSPASADSRSIHVPRRATTAPISVIPMGRSASYLENTAGIPQLWSTTGIPQQTASSTPAWGNPWQTCIPLAGSDSTYAMTGQPMGSQDRSTEYRVIGPNSVPGLVEQPIAASGVEVSFGPGAVADFQTEASLSLPPSHEMAPGAVPHQPSTEEDEADDETDFILL